MFVVKWQIWWTFGVTYLAVIGLISRNAFAASTYTCIIQPSHYTQRSPITKNVGEEVNLTCEACTTVKNRNVSFAWSHDGVNVATSANGCSSLSWPYCGEGHRYCHSAFRLSSIRVSHRGAYTCTAACDDHQTTSTTYIIQVKGAPHFVTHPLPRNISQGNDVTLSCEVESHPVSEVIWWTNSGDEIKNSSHESTGDFRYRSTVTLEGVTKGCQIFCQVRNRFGSVNSTMVYINIKEVPEPVTPNVDNKTISSTSMMVSWARGFDGYTPITMAYIKWQPIDEMENTTMDNSASNMTTLHNLTSDEYIIANLQPATLYDVKVAVSNDQGMSNWSHPLCVKTKYSVPPAPSHVSAHCYTDKVNISWSSVPDGRDYGHVDGFLVILLDMKDKSEVRVTTLSSENHKLIHNKQNTTYKISVHGVSQGGQGSPKSIVYHCVPEFNTEEDGDDVGETTVISSASTTNVTFRETTVFTTDVQGISSAVDLILPVAFPSAASSSKHNSPSLHQNVLFIPILIAAFVVVVVLMLSLAYRYHRRNSEKNIELNVPIRAYVGEIETTNEDLGFLSHGQADPIRRGYPHPVNSYQTHIVNLQDDDGYNYNLGATSDPCRLLRLPSQESDYENCVADFARQINLDPQCKQKFYEALIPFQCVTMGKMVGEGEFGEVSIGYINQGSSDEVKIAIKTMKDVTDIKSYEVFIKEGIITTEFDHHNVLAIIGISLARDIVGCSIPLVIMPFMENGDLRTYLYNARVQEKVQMALYQLVGFMIDIASGMEYLADNKFVHRDLAARNCMLDSDLTVKIADFGLTRNVCGADYYRICQNGKSCKIPVKWVAIESLRDGKFTSSSDVWAYGVTMWEVITQSEIPYPGISNCSIYQHLVDGNRLRQPAGCPDNLYSLMLSCWEADEIRRPCFAILKDSLLKLSMEWKKMDLYVASFAARLETHV